MDITLQIDKQFRSYTIQQNWKQIIFQRIYFQTLKQNKILIINEIQVLIKIILYTYLMRTLQPKLWKDSEITMNYVTPQASFSKEKRFKLYSIYWPDKATADINKKINHLSETEEMARKISKIIDEEEKNQIRQLKSHKIKFAKEKISTEIPVKTQMSFNLRNKNKYIVNNKVGGIVRRLSCTSERKQSSRRDKYGFRSPYNQQLQQLQLMPKQSFGSTMYSSKGFKTAQRINLNLPENYYPGPGTYRIVRYLQQSQNIQKNNAKELD